MKRIKGRLVDKQLRVDIDFANREIADIKIQRVKLGIDRTKMISDRRITKAIINDREWENMKQRIIKLPRKEDLSEGELT